MLVSFGGLVSQLPESMAKNVDKRGLIDFNSATGVERERIKKSVMKLRVDELVLSQPPEVVRIARVGETDGDASSTGPTIKTDGLDGVRVESKLTTSYWTQAVGLVFPGTDRYMKDKKPQMSYNSRVPVTRPYSSPLPRVSKPPPPRSFPRATERLNREQKASRESLSALKQMVLNERQSPS
jgi:hypothetical protein